MNLDEEMAKELLDALLQAAIEYGESIGQPILFEEERRRDATRSATQADHAQQGTKAASQDSHSGLFLSEERDGAAS